MSLNAWNDEENTNLNSSCESDTKVVEEEGIDDVTSKLFENLNLNENLSLDQIDLIRRKGVDISPRKDSALMKLKLKKGLGLSKPLFGDTAYVKYVMWKEDGEKVGSSDEAVTFVVGKAEVLLAWEFSIVDMTETETAVVLSTAELAHGETGLSTRIPPNSSLIFHLQLMRWHGEDISEEKDGSLYRSVVEKGEAYGGPNNGARCTVDLIGRCRGREFECRTVQFDYGEGEAVGIVEGVEKGLEKSSRGEQVRFKVASKLGYGEEGCLKHNIPPNSDLEYDIHLKECQREKDFWDLSMEEKVEKSAKEKDKAVSYFKNGDLKMAVKLFKRVVEFLMFATEKELSSEEKVEKLSNAMVSLGICHLRMDDPFAAEDLLNQALQVDAGNKKALYNRAQANRKMKNYGKVVEDLKMLSHVGGGSNTVRLQLQQALKDQQDFKDSEKKKYFGMFERKTKKVNVPTDETVSV